MHVRTFPGPEKQPNYVNCFIRMISTSNTSGRPGEQAYANQSEDEAYAPLSP